jgi:hypothetical protein
VTLAANTTHRFLKQGSSKVLKSTFGRANVETSLGKRSGDVQQMKVKVEVGDFRWDFLFGVIKRYKRSQMKADLIRADFAVGGEKEWLPGTPRALANKLPKGMYNHVKVQALKGAPLREGSPLKAKDKTAANVVHRFLKQGAYFSVGDLILYGKYKNKKGRIISITKDEKGYPAVEIEPFPKGRKQNKVLTLFKIRKYKPKKKTG